MKPFNETFLVVAMVVFATSAHATFFNNTTGIASPDQTITFESVALSANEPVETQFQSLGVTFSTAFANPDPAETYPNIAGNRIGNFQSHVTQYGLFTAYFSENLNEVAFAVASAPGESTFSALLNGIVLETAVRSTSAADSTNFFGFKDLVFNQITISTASTDHTFLLDNLQTVAVVPELSTWALLLAG